MFAVLACSTPSAAAAQRCGGGSGVRATLEGVIAADNARDLDAVLAHYTDDVAWLPPGRAPIEGLAAIRARYQAMYAQYAPELAIGFDDVRAGEALATARGRTSGTLRPAEGPGETVIVNDQYLAVLRCEGARWRIATMMWSPALEE